MVQKYVSALLATITAVGVVAQSTPAQACLSGLEGQWTRENICTDAFSSGGSQGIISPYSLRANLIFGSLAIAGGFDADGNPVDNCAAVDQTEGDGPGEAVPCSLDAVQHNIQVNG
jgi:hypothetical protein